jgi:chromosome segregation ATPase
MLNDLDAQIAEARQQLGDRERIKQTLAATRERLGRKNYDLNVLEACLASIEADVKAFESITLASLWDSMLGRRDVKLNEKREEAASMHQEFEQCAADVSTMGQQVKEMEEQLTALADIDRTFQSLCEQKQQEILERGDEQAEQLRGLVDELIACRAERQRVEKAIQIGKHVHERLSSMTSAMGRARNKTVHAGAAGALVSAAVTAVLRAPAGGSVDRAVKGLEEFGNAVGELSHADNHRDTELIRLSTTVRECAATLAGQGVTGLVFDYGAAGPGVETVQDALGHLQDKREELLKHIAGLESERIAIIGNS